MRFINPLHALPVKEEFESELKEKEVTIAARSFNIGKGSYKFIKADVKAQLAITEGWLINVCVKNREVDKEEEYELTEFLEAANIAFDRSKYKDQIIAS